MKKLEPPTIRVGSLRTPIRQTQRYGFYSAIAAKSHGVMPYVGEDGKEVETTTTHTSTEIFSRYNYPNLYCVGPVYRSVLREKWYLQSLGRS